LDGKPLVEQPGWANEPASDDEQTSRAWLNNQKLLSRLGGIIADSEDSSTNYKQQVAEYLDKKFPQQHPLMTSDHGILPKS
jgi:hypothetical protein